MKYRRGLLLLILLVIVSLVALILLLSSVDPPPLRSLTAARGVKNFDPQKLTENSTATPTTDMFITWAARLETTDIAATNAVQTQPSPSTSIP